MPKADPPTSSTDSLPPSPEHTRSLPNAEIRDGTGSDVCMHDFRIFGEDHDTDCDHGNHEHQRCRLQSKHHFEWCGFRRGSSTSRELRREQRCSGKRVENKLKRSTEEAEFGQFWETVKGISTHQRQGSTYKKKNNLGIRGMMEAMMNRISGLTRVLSDWN
jgi:hypothetical protein